MNTKLLRQTIGERFLTSQIFERIRVSRDRVRDNSDTKNNRVIRVM